MREKVGAGSGEGGQDPEFYDAYSRDTEGLNPCDVPELDSPDDALDAGAVVWMISTALGPDSAQNPE